MMFVAALLLQKPLGGGAERRARSPPSLILRTFLDLGVTRIVWEAGVAQDTAQKPVSWTAPAGASAQLGGGERRARRWAPQGWQRSTRRLANSAPTWPAADWSRPQMGGVGPSRALLDERGSLLERLSKGSTSREMIENPAWAEGFGWGKVA